MAQLGPVAAAKLARWAGAKFKYVNKDTMVGSTQENHPRGPTGIAGA